MILTQEDFRATRPAWKNVIFVLGGPGSGKGTNCALIAKEFNYVHLTAGDLLREEVAKGTETGKLIDECIRDGQIVPKEVTIGLLRNAMIAKVDATGFLIDGFPRKMDQAEAFEDTVASAKFVLFFDCPEATLEKRLLERGKTSGRSDDNIESIRKRFKTYFETTMPVIKRYNDEHRLITVDSSRPLQSVYAEARKAFMS